MLFLLVFLAGTFGNGTRLASSFSDYGTRDEVKELLKTDTQSLLEGWGTRYLVGGRQRAMYLNKQFFAL